MEPSFLVVLGMGLPVALSIFMMYLSPYVIEPLFNKFTPIEDGSLKERILAITKRRVSM